MRFVKYKSKEYCKELATVKYLVNNVSFPSYFLKREGQVLIDTWHGTPLKNMGFDIPGAIFLREIQQEICSVQII